jgi:2-dehydro-3-deoxy-D-arabinonate dehydratase
VTGEISGLYRIGLADGSTRLALGHPFDGPARLLPIGLTLDTMLSGSSATFTEALAEASDGGPVPDDHALLAPVESQEVWGAGVTYVRSRDAREQESEADASAYDRVYRADRPELFFKSAGWRVRGLGESIGVRWDSTWSVPEPELALILAADLSLAGYSIGDDVSSRSIEGENTLYLPQAKTYDGSCAIGPCIVPIERLPSSFGMRLSVIRDGEVETEGETSTDQLNRSFAELASFLGRATTFPVGAVLLTGTGIVPRDSFTLLPGDIVRIEVDHLGVLENPVVVVGAPPPAA